ncbi:ABC transporter ATP-binding protein [Erysipelothrix urinaevulpis]|uniref:ABC transporter ATP-binding protein n=1 Tax=Erysipelothrix urinaevulpis TaxID=2683717 RepID=UPI00135B4C29|nr:ABC transporter ATP-binding protein [Erysipelothrix urinaevulpis]
MKEVLLSIKNVDKYYGDFKALDNLSLDVYKGEFLTLLGPSGCGKTTILRSIAGFETISSGGIELEGQSIMNLPPEKRSVNTVFQNYALFPHLTVYENIIYGPKMQGTIPKEKHKEAVFDVLELVQMTGYEDRNVSQLSGGQKQRIAIARALINKPDILLLDEPLGALDQKLRKHMQLELSRIQKESKTTFIYVTHDQEEALNMSDRLAIMNKGVIQQIGNPKEVYNDPSNLFVADFIGERNLVHVDVSDFKDNKALVYLNKSPVWVDCHRGCSKSHALKNEVILAVHSDKMSIKCDQSEGSFPAQVLSSRYTGSQVRTEILVNDQTMMVIEYGIQDCRYEENDEVYVTWGKDSAVILPKGRDTDEG